MPRKRSRVVLISGASTGIGRALAITFAARGDVVVALARSRRALESVRRKIERNGGVCVALPCDVRKPDSVRTTVRAARRVTGMPEILIHNAGVTTFKSFLKTSPMEFDDILQTNLKGMFLLTKEILPSMVQRKSGMIVNILSLAAKVIYTGSSAYSASKAGGSALMNVVREEMRNKGVRVVNVYPGAVLTRMWSHDTRRKFAHRMMRPDEIAELVYQTTMTGPGTTVEELVIRPRQGDLAV